MYLLQEMQLRVDQIDPVHGQQIGEEERVIYDKAKDEFLERLGRPGEGVNLVRNVFRLMDELTEEYLRDNEISCHRGCSWCCHQLVCCTTLEMELIIDYIDSLPRSSRRSLKQKIRKGALNFYHYYQRNKKSFLGSSFLSTTVGIERWEDIGPALRKAHRRKPCLFLDRDICSIYPVRPVDCRIAKTKDKICGMRARIWIKEPKQIRLFFDQVASDLITYEEEKVYGKLQVVPLIGWPLTEKFYPFFFSKGGVNLRKEKKRRKKKRKGISH